MRPIWANLLAIVSVLNIASAPVHAEEIRFETKRIGTHRSEACGVADFNRVFWSAAVITEFSAGSSVTFSPNHDGEQWHDYTVTLPAVAPALTHLRLDPGNAPGLVRIARIVLKDASGKVVKSWIE